ncbi:hypothetical protein CN300_26230 [Bacillus thuringiensis]|uniref:hypothetical protein n=2 Tax=Bacteria TaxID=2 RepID=UPI000BF7BC7B|nr:hypothetical protein [Bacillus thuringiensis]PFC40635.1 hypothetical protein CN300_26230 [Bacillus thuringiensis]
MNNYQRLRLEFNNNWEEGKRISLPHYNLLMEKIHATTTGGFIPFKFPETDDNEFHKALAYFLDGLDGLPLRPDIAFDNTWRAVDSYVLGIFQGNTEQPKKTWDLYIDSYQIVKDTFERFHNLIPLQSLEFLSKRLLNNSISNVERRHVEHIRRRVKRVLNEVDNALYDDILTKYNIFNADTQRKCASLFKIVLAGQSINLNDRDVQLNTKQNVVLILDGIIYSSRNERFHGDSFPQFLSSKAKMSTFASGYFVFLYTYFLFLLLVHYDTVLELEISSVIENINVNLDIYEELFLNSIKR